MSPHFIDIINLPVFVLLFMYTFKIMQNNIGTQLEERLVYALMETYKVTHMKDDCVVA